MKRGYPDLMVARIAVGIQGVGYQPSWYHTVSGWAHSVGYPGWRTKIIGRYPSLRIPRLVVARR